MKFLLLFSLLLTTSCSKKYILNDSEKSFINVVHYNVKELDSTKLKSSNKQMKSVKNILKRFDFDILSLNEVQYDLPNIPNKDFQTKGENLKAFAKIIGKKNMHSVFSKANTGNLAKKNEFGEYFSNYSSPKARKSADQRNFGIFPGQYSTGALVDEQIEVINIKVIDKLKWIEFNPKIDFSKFRYANGQKIEKEIELFDKSFIDATLKKDGKVFHLILLHTVPAFHFGNKKSVNYERNADQLRFLEWYLTGSTDREIILKDILPLKEGTPFIAMGDWNTELSNMKNPGSEILRSLKTKITFWLKGPIAHTNESSHFAPNPLRLQLDYIAFSEHFQSINSGIYRPESKRKELGCDRNYIRKNTKSYFIKKDKKVCYATFSDKYIELKEASDHFPLWANLIWKD